MSRIVESPITVTLGPDGAGDLRPVMFTYRQERHHVAEILDVWTMLAGPWWEDAAAVGRAPAEVQFWRIRTTRYGVFELTQTGTAWRLYKIYD